MVKLLEKIKTTFWCGGEVKVPRSLTFHPLSNQIVGRVLCSYLVKSLFVDSKNELFKGHSNGWESKEIVRIFNQLGYIVDVINWDDFEFLPNHKYDVIFDIYINLQRLEQFAKKNCIKIMHLTGSYSKYQNNAEIRRVNDFNVRKGASCKPRRLINDVELNNRSLQIADFCSLIGNEHTLKTYPEEFQKKITNVTVSASFLKKVKSVGQYVPQKREFLWFFGGGAIHKGLDLVLDVFAVHKDLVLNIVGNVELEKDFFKVYEKELSLPNIKYHGPMYPSSRKFVSILKNVFCFIAPSCSESISAAVATCLQIGLFPIVSFDTGVSLPQNCGIYLDKLNMQEVEKSVLTAHSMKEEILSGQIYKTQQYALKNFSKEKFTCDMINFLSKALMRKDTKTRKGMLESSL